MNAKWRTVFRRGFGPLEPVAVRLYEAILKKIRYLDPGLRTYRASAGRPTVDPRSFSRPFSTVPKDLAVILAAGASNIANEGDPNGRFVPHANVFNFSFLNGRVYVARDPLIGATEDRSNVLTRIGDALVKGEHFKRVLLVPVAHGGTYIHEWSPGGRMHPRLSRALKQLRRKGIVVTHFLWQQGEAEADQSQPDAAAWLGHFNAIANVVRAEAPECDIYVARCTICRNAPNPVIRAAQEQALDLQKRIFPGPDLDVIGLDDRWDCCHFSVRGLERATEVWLRALEARSPQSVTGGGGGRS